MNIPILKNRTNIRSRKLDSFHRLAFATVVSSCIYLLWLSLNIQTLIGLAFFFLEIGIFFIVALFSFNHWSRSYQMLGGSYSIRSSVDVFIPTVNEPLKVLEKSMAAAAALEYPNKTLYLLDDGPRKSIKKLAKKYGFVYLTRPDIKAKKYKSANLNYGLSKSYSAYVLTIDADNIVSPTIIDDILGHFKDERVAIVASRQAFNIEKNDFNHDHLFYSYMQAGKNSDGAAISCGSGVIYRRSALNEIGGFSEWNLVEDLHTTYILNQKGYRSVFVTQPFVSGHAPKDLGVVYKQRGTWALDTLRMFFWQQPMFKRSLSLRQRLHYFEIGYCYIASAILLPAIFLINFYTLFTNQEMIGGGWWYVFFRAPALLCTLLLFGRFSQGQLTSRIWAGMFPVYLKATVLALLYRKKKPKYKVTSKVDSEKRALKLVIPQIIFVLVGFILVFYHAYTFGLTLMLWFSFFWITVMFYWLMPIILKAAKIRY